MAFDTLGKRVRLMRLDKQMTQSELRAKIKERCGVDVGYSYISHLERNTKRPTFYVMVAIARVLDTSLDYFGLMIDEAESYRRAPSTEVVPYFSQEAEDIAEIVDNLPAAQRAFLLQTAESLSSMSQRQMERRDMADILDSIERKVGHGPRTEIERTLRRAGLALPTRTAAS